MSKRETRKKLAMGAFLLFVTGILLVPAMHKLGLLHSHDSGVRDVPHSHGPHGHSHNHSHEHPHEHAAPDEPRSSQPNQHHHDPATCSITQIEKTPVDTPVAASALPHFEPLEIAPPVAPHLPDFKTPRLLPFSCGPPA